MLENNFHTTQFRVRYKDTDRMGFVYYGNYLTYFEVARSDYMRSLGVPYASLESQGYSLVVVEANAKYHGNVGYDSLISIRSRITELKRVRIRFDYEVFDENDNLLVNGYTVHACLNSSKRPERIPDELQNAFMAMNSKTMPPPD
ncbi:MAG TPA: thioesterase family protein [Desulfobacteraceae bacterium]|nr:thioesterase family protein [Desulfobacteraceae bacterium]HPJ67469.1 thioesterase family protein [Desulfobacteraceae bacterium]HPQ30027.1 thioesterase family protein [Desulfobacteraceae bacterium]